MKKTVLEYRNLAVDMKSGGTWIRVVEQVHLRLLEGEILCLVGESGSGKSVTALAAGRLHDPKKTRYHGEIFLDQIDVLKLHNAQLRKIRGKKVAYIFQDPAASLNPTWKSGKQVMEMLRLHQPARADRKFVIDLFRRVGISAPETRVDQYPFELSGGMQQRVMIAMALAAAPDVLIADEPTTALDVTIQDQILRLLLEIRDETGMGILLITHNLAIVRQIADRIAVMYAGHIQEEGRADEVLSAPRHPYTRLLMEAVPSLEHYQLPLQQIPGSPPTPAAFPMGCRFHPRCPIARSTCEKELPFLEDPIWERTCRCHFPYESE